VLEAMEQRNEKRGMAAICIGGGQGGAMYLERVTEVKGHE
jgi:acetyl-CoA C-acetyltransferase